MQIKTTTENRSHTLSITLTPSEDGSDDVSITRDAFDYRKNMPIQKVTVVRPTDVFVRLQDEQIYGLSVSGDVVRKDGTRGVRRDSIYFTIKSMDDMPAWLTTIVAELARQWWTRHAN